MNLKHKSYITKTNYKIKMRAIFYAFFNKMFVPTFYRKSLKELSHKQYLYNPMASRRP